MFSDGGGLGLGVRDVDQAERDPFNELRVDNEVVLWPPLPTGDSDAGRDAGNAPGTFRGDLPRELVP